MLFTEACRESGKNVVSFFSETSLIQHSMGPKNSVGLGGCSIVECLLPYICMVTVPHIMVGLERMMDYRGVGLARFHCSMIAESANYLPISIIDHL